MNKTLLVMIFVGLLGCAGADVEADAALLRALLQVGPLAFLRGALTVLANELVDCRHGVSSETG